MKKIFDLQLSACGAFSNWPNQMWEFQIMTNHEEAILFHVRMCAKFFFFCTLKKVWLAISSTELRRRVVVAPIPAGRRREEPAGEVAESLVDLAPRYFYAGDFRLEIRSALGYSTSFWENKSACWVYKIAKKYDFEFWTENWGPYSHSM